MAGQSTAVTAIKGIYFEQAEGLAGFCGAGLGQAGQGYANPGQLFENVWNTGEEMRKEWPAPSIKRSW